MPLATKNGSIIVKDGKLAENCGCCGGWYCGHGPTFSPSPPPEVSPGIGSISVTVSNALYSGRKVMGSHNLCDSYNSIYTARGAFYPIADYSGTVVLSKQSDFQWSRNYTDSVGNIGSATVTLASDYKSYTVSLLTWRYYFTIVQAYTAPSFLSLSDMPLLTQNDISEYGPYSRVTGGWPLYKCVNGEGASSSNIPLNGSDLQTKTTLFYSQIHTWSFVGSLPDCIPTGGLSRSENLFRDFFLESIYGMIRIGPHQVDDNVNWQDARLAVSFTSSVA
jgi:hypothetical protein